MGSCIVELGNEPSLLSGAGAPKLGSAWYGYIAGGTSSYNIGLWDSGANIDPTACEAWYGAPFLDYFCKELETLDTLGLPLVGPTFTCVDIAAELASFDEAVLAARVKWIDLARAKGPLTFGANLYYNAFDTVNATGEVQKYVWPSFGPVEYADVAINGFDGRGAKSDDHQCAKWKLSQINIPERGINPKNVVIVEAGLQPYWMGMSDSPSTTHETVGPQKASYPWDLQTVGQANIKLLDSLRTLSKGRTILFTVSDAVSSYTGANERQRFGVFTSDINFSDRVVPNDQVTYSASLAWAMRAGLPLTDGPENLPLTGTYWGDQFLAGDSERVP